MPNRPEDRSKAEAETLKSCRILANQLGHNLTRQDTAEDAADLFERVATNKRSEVATM